MILEQPTYFFPSIMESDFARVLDTLEMRLDVLELHRQQSLTSAFSVFVNDEKIIIPERVYCSAEEENTALLSPLQKQMTSCILTRHHDGFVREKALRQIVRCNESWIAPYVVNLLGDYVVEILEVLAANTATFNPDIYGKCIRDNAAFFNLAASRTISYWNANSRRSCPDKNQYVGVRALKLLKQFP